MKANLNCGQVRGPVQMGFAKSVDPILPQEITITRVAITTEEECCQKRNGNGRKYIVPYGLYRVEGYVSANLARKVTGFSEEDLELLWKAILNMFENDHAAARGKMAVRKLIIFKHDSELGNAPSYKLFEAVKVARKPGVDLARAFSDYDGLIAGAAARELPVPVWNSIAWLSQGETYGISGGGLFIIIGNSAFRFLPQTMGSDSY